MIHQPSNLSYDEDTLVSLDAENSMQRHVANLCRISYYHLWELRRVRRYLNHETAVKVANALVKGQSWGFTSRSTARVILGQVLRIATCGTRTHRGDSL